MEIQLKNGTDRLKTIFRQFFIEKLNLSELSEEEVQREIEIWLESALKKIQKNQKIRIQSVTHIVKASHPKADSPSGFYPPSKLRKIDLVGSHCMSAQYPIDAVANAADLGVIAFLWSEFDGKTLLQLADEKYPDFAALLSNDPNNSMKLMEGFSSLFETKEPPCSHSLVKQIYWPINNAFAMDESFHLLQPIFAGSLSHLIFRIIENALFGEKTKIIRAAKKANEFHADSLQIFSNMVVQKLGGSNAQNVSYLNAKRKGKNYLIASLPPLWISEQNKPLLNTDSMMRRYKQRLEVKSNVRRLLKFLQSDPSPNLETRQIRAQYVNNLLEEFLFFTLEIREISPGWTALAECKLKSHQACWLDPQADWHADEAEGILPPTDVPGQVANDFALWLNNSLLNGRSGGLPVGDAEHTAWRRHAKNVFKAFERGGMQAAGLLLDDVTDLEEESAHV